ncbi:hypothetical protein RchiOBHm_Chr1g0329131 [Rosa chinensis]|uniref:Pentatricopeptide n=1 Tax=Rosa chinensis TaxID=74649 RepID=A0A2P6SAX7_ROSCH|nr:hypothetical protein RchiOBHm_Chr1g0329131 [Rosa chinensis]
MVGGICQRRLFLCFSEMVAKHNSVTLVCVISAYAKLKDERLTWESELKSNMLMFEEAIELFRVMRTEGIKGDRLTMVEVASTCGYLGALDLAKLTPAYIQNKKHN